jgi:hypothetical protein
MNRSESVSVCHVLNAYQPAGHLGATASVAQPSLDAAPDKWLFFKDDGKNYQYWVPALAGTFMEGLKRCHADGGVLFDLPQVRSNSLTMNIVHLPLD